ncbi:MAG: hypothetical protein H0V79_00590 [Actinobacteria bacterium]|nr:hypothetical protein [Actinomycetota bacterium]
MKRLVLGLVLLALATPADAHASTPLPWCGTDISALDRAPDASAGFSVHVIYAIPPGAPDRFGEWAPRLAGDAAAIEAWWRSQDAARAPRFDLHPFPCASVFGTLDLSRVQLSAGVGDIRSAFSTIRLLLGREQGFRQSEKVYLVYYDAPTGQIGRERVCGQAATERAGVSAFAVVFLDSCGSDDADEVRPIVAAHELIHALGAVDATAAPNGCSGGHVCDSTSDLMTATLRDGPLESRVLDSGRNDYYGHAGSWDDLQDSRFLERLDSADRVAPSVPAAPTITSDRFGTVRFSWSPSTDDVGPVSYRVSRDGIFFEEVERSSALLEALLGSTSTYSVRAADAVGRLSAPVSVRFTAGLGIVDASGLLVRDTVPPTPVTKVAVRKLGTRVVLTWARALDGVGLSGYRVRIGARTLSTSRERLSVQRSRVTGPITIAAVDRAGNVGPAATVPLRRLR